MREIKFRAWHQGKMTYYHSFNINIGGEVYYLDTSGEWQQDEDKHVIIMQYTGLKDKNSKEIYEGDIVDIGYGRGKVVFNVGCFMLEWINDPEANMELLGIADKYGRVRDQIEIIGNIYENPELLKP